MKNGFVKVAAAVPPVKVADCKFNTEQILNLMARAEGTGVDVLCFPELCITGYSCQDLFQQRLLQDEAIASLLKILELSHNMPRLTTIVGLPIVHDGLLLNCAAVVGQGKVYGLVPKTFIPNHAEYNEKRWFNSSMSLYEGTTYHFCGQHVPLSSRLVFSHGEYRFGVEIGEDLWAPMPRSCRLALEDADVIFNLSAGCESAGRGDYLRQLVIGQSGRCMAGYVYVGCGYGESTQDVVCAGRSLIVENGLVLAEGQPFTMQPHFTVTEIDVERLRQDRLKNTTFTDSKSYAMQAGVIPYRCVELDNVSCADHFVLNRNFDPLPFIPEGEAFDRRCEEILAIQSEGLARRIEHTQAKSVVVGISGGLDSTLALLVAVKAFDRLEKPRKGIVGVTMPGFGTTDRTYTNALTLMKRLGITLREINIREACEVHFRDLGHDMNVHDVTFENSQARERTQILMDMANQMGGFVVGTGDLSELALGWATYNGDHMSMYGVNAAVPKTLVRYLVSWVAHHLSDEEVSRTLIDIVETPISPELIPADEAGNMTQKTEDLVGPYELHDFFIYYTLRYGFRPSKIFAMAVQAFNGSSDRVESYDEATIKKWLTTFYRRFFTQQFKRNCLPDGPKVGSCGLSPRGDWHMPSDAYSRAWLEECENL